MWTPLGITPPAFSVCWFRHGCLYLVSTLALGVEGSSLNPIQASESIVILETNVCTSSVRLGREDSVWCSGRYLNIPETSWQLLRIAGSFSVTYKSVIETSVKVRRRSSSSCVIARQCTHNCCSMTSRLRSADCHHLISSRSHGRAIQHTYIVSPIDRAGLIGMAQTLAVYHYGYYTLKDRMGPAVNTPFSSQDKPPLAIAMVVTVHGVRSLKKFRLVIAQKSKLRLTQEVTAALASHSREHRLRASSFFPCSTDRKYLYGYAGDGYRSPLWLCASYNGSPVLVHRLRGSKMYFHQATKDRRILLIPGIHYFDAHRLQPLLLQAPALQVHVRESSLVGPEGAGEQVDDPSLDEEQATTASETEAESEEDDENTPPEEPWCPPTPPAMDDPPEQEIKGAADKLATMISSSQPSASVFYHPDNLGALPHLWLQAKLTISLTSAGKVCSPFHDDCVRTMVAGRD